MYLGAVLQVTAMLPNVGWHVLSATVLLVDVLCLTRSILLYAPCCLCCTYFPYNSKLSMRPLEARSCHCLGMLGSKSEHLVRRQGLCRRLMILPQREICCKWQLMACAMS